VRLVDGALVGQRLALLGVADEEGVAALLEVEGRRLGRPGRDQESGEIVDFVRFEEDDRIETA
jgi:hypothetical protein